MSLYVAHNLINGQIGYSIVLEAENIANDWPKNYIVIATCEADPFCIDVSQINSPIFYVMHGMDEWVFDEIFDSLTTILKAMK